MGNLFYTDNNDIIKINEDLDTTKKKIKYLENGVIANIEIELIKLRKDFEYLEQHISYVQQDHEETKILMKQNFKSMYLDNYI